MAVAIASLCVNASDEICLHYCGQPRTVFLGSTQFWAQFRVQTGRVGPQGQKRAQMGPVVIKKGLNSGF